jgi:hypothetical protein
LDEKYIDAEEVLRDASALPGASAYTLATLGYALGRSGQHRAARQILTDLEARRRVEYVSPVALATASLGVGEYEQALDWAEQSFDERRGWLAYMDVNPVLDPLRASPRFGSLRRRMGL